MYTFANLPEYISSAISGILSSQPTKEWLEKTEVLHQRYTERDKRSQGYVRDFPETLAYLGLRTPATYAQIFGSLSAVQEMLPDWQPETVLDIGSGPGTGAWAAKELFPKITSAVCIDRSSDFLTVGRNIASRSKFPVNMEWIQQDLRDELEMTEQYDVVILANVLNEITHLQGETLIEQALSHCKGVLLIIEPGTEEGNRLVSSFANMFSESDGLLAPYVQSSFVSSNKYWTHFSQRFTRPDFERRVRQYLRNVSEMASDWEEAKYTYVAVTSLPFDKSSWGRCIGPVEKQKGFVEVPVLTAEKIEKVKVLKRYKAQYTFAKNLKWGELIRENLIEKS